MDTAGYWKLIRSIFCEANASELIFLIIISIVAMFCHPVLALERGGSFDLPRSILSNEYYCDEQNGIPPMKRVLGFLKDETSFWSRYKKVIFLAEGGDSNWEGKNWHIPFATALHQTFPLLQIVKTDLDKAERSSGDGKMIDLPVNHRHSFARSIVGKIGKADAVMMLRGLCHCGIINQNFSMTCGGLNTARQEELQKFLIQVVECVDWENSNSFVYLEGLHFSQQFENKNFNYKEPTHQYQKRILRQSKAFNRWRKAAAKVAQFYGIDFYFEHLRNSDFKGIVFRPHTEVSFD